MGNITKAWASGKDVPRNHCLIPPGRLTFLLVGHIPPHSYVLPSPLWLTLGVDQRRNLPVAGSTGLSHASVESRGRRKPPFSLLELGSRVGQGQGMRLCSGNEVLNILCQVIKIVFPVKLVNFFLENF